MTEVNNVIPTSNEEDTNTNDDQVNVDGDVGYEVEAGDNEEAQQDDGDLQFLTTVVVASPSKPLRKRILTLDDFAELLFERQLYSGLIGIA